MHRERACVRMKEEPGQERPRRTGHRTAPTRRCAASGIAACAVHDRVSLPQGIVPCTRVPTAVRAAPAGAGNRKQALASSGPCYDGASSTPSHAHAALLPRHDLPVFCRIGGRHCYDRSARRCFGSRAAPGQVGAVRPTCDSAVRMQVAASALTLTNGSDSQTLGGIEMAGPGYFRLTIGESRLS